MNIQAPARRNIQYRLRENQSLAQPRPVLNVILDASLEVRTAVVYATFIVALVFLPVLTLTGLQGSFFAPLALSYILAIMASLAVALTLTPALSLLFFARGVRDAGALSPGREPDRARLERQSAFTVENWRQQAPTDRACVFLGADGVCTVYEFRPNVCRKLLVVTDPALCDATHQQPDSVGRWFSWEAELMESAALETFGAGLMPIQLMHALNAQDAVD